MNKVDEEYYFDLIGRTKWVLSELAGRDIGTPKTVDLLVEILRRVDSAPSRDELIVGYLFSRTNDDKDGINGSRFDGELRRYGAQKRKTTPDKISPSPMLRAEYNREFNIKV